MHFDNTLKWFVTAVFPSKMAASVRNGGRSMAFSVTQYLCFFDLLRSPAVAPRITPAIGIRILSPALAKAMSELTKKSRKGEGSNGFLEGLFTNRRVHEHQSELSRCGAIGEYGQIW